MGRITVFRQVSSRLPGTSEPRVHGSIVGMHTSAEHGPRPHAVQPAAHGRIRGLAVRTTGLARPLAGTRWFRLWAVLHHAGRSTGRAYRIPIVAFPTTTGFLIPLPFGTGTQWLKNIQAADSAGLRRAGRDHAIDRPVVRPLDEIADDLPAPIAFAAWHLGIDTFVEVRRVPDDRGVRQR
jgi:hypothetical protein